ncbi:TolC family protein [Pirellulaceae bacterium SH449]
MVRQKIFSSNNVAGTWLITLLASSGVHVGCSSTKNSHSSNLHPSTLPPTYIASAAGAFIKQDAAPDLTGQQLNTESVRPVSFVAAAERYQADDRSFLVSEAIIEETFDASPASTSQNYTLSDIESIALGNNPTLLGAEILVQKASSLRYQVGLAPNPTFGYFGQQIAAQGTDQHGVFVEQEFVRGNKLELNRNILASTQNAQRWAVMTQQYRLLTDIRIGFYEALAAQQQLEVAKSLLNVAERGVQIATDRLKAGEGSQIDVLQSQTLLSEISLTVEQLELAYRGAWRHLAAVAGLGEVNPVMLDGELKSADAAPDWDSVLSELLESSPELAVASSLVAEKAALVRREQAQVIPNVTGQIGAGYDRGTDTGLINLQVAAPIPVWNKNTGNISAAYADYRRAQEEVKRLEQSIRSRLAIVARDFDSSTAAVRRYEKEILPQSEKALELAESAYKAGELDFLQVLVLRRAYFEALLKSIAVKGQFSVSDAQIDGLLLSQSMDASLDFTSGDGLRSASFGGQ